MKIHELSLIYSILLELLFGISWPQQYESLFALGLIVIRLLLIHCLMFLPFVYSPSLVLARGGGGGGPICLFSIGTQITCDFPGSGFGPPVPPLDPLMKTHSSDVLLKV